MAGFGKNEVFNKNKNCESIFLPHEHLKAYGATKNVYEQMREGQVHLRDRKWLHGRLRLRDTPPCVYNSDLCPRARILNLGTMDTPKDIYHYPSYLR